MIKQKEISKKISLFFSKNKYSEAQELLETLLKKETNNIWLLSNLAITFYELHNYKKALFYSAKVLKSKTRDPLFLNYHALILRMNSKETDAISIWESLLARGVSKIANEDCNENVLWVKSLLNDIRYTLAVTYNDLGNHYLARKFIKNHLKYRKRGQFSLYTKKQAENLLKKSIIY